MRKRFLATLCTTLFITLLSTCDSGGAGSTNSPPTLNTITFVSNGGSTVDSQTLDDDELIIEPTEPTRTNFDFVGWYTNETYTSKWQFDSDTVTTDVSLYAKWKMQIQPLEAFNADGITFKMASIFGPQTFQTRIDTYATWSDTITKDYLIAETEVTYELWYTVYDWAVNGAGGSTGEGQYSIANPGREGSNGIDGAVPTANNQEPVAFITWRDALVWCNALTEWYNSKNGTSLECVYFVDPSFSTPLRTSTASDTITFDVPGSEDAPYVNSDSRGFRLPEYAEWSLAATIRENEINSTTGYCDGWYTSGYALSGAVTVYDDDSEGSGEPAKTANAAVAIYGKYYDDGSWISTGITKTAVVKSLGPDGANSLGLYDMSGNVTEWCFDWVPPGASTSARFSQGGSYSVPASSCRTGAFVGTVPYAKEAGGAVGGLRFAKNRN